MGKKPKRTLNVWHNVTTVADFIDVAVKMFKKSGAYYGHGTDNAWDDVVYLVLSSLGLSHASDKAVLSRILTADEKQDLGQKLQRRVQDYVPTPYLLNEAWFAGLSFYVDERVLIPRSPVAELIESLFVPWIDPGRVKRILDVGTGSGCIAVACSYAFPKAKIDAIDVSASALQVAAINCNKHKMTKNIRLLHSDLFAKLGGQKYDIIISNPPYVGSKEMKTLPKEYGHEPKEALHAGKRGDEIVTEIIDKAASHLTPEGILVVEVGNSASLVTKKYPHLPFVWLEFECGESEVFLLSKKDLDIANKRHQHT